MRRMLRGVVWAVSVVVLLGVFGLLVPRPLFEKPQDAAVHDRIILVISNPIHTDIAIPLNADTRERFAFLLDAGVPIDHPAARWIVFGWGGRSFYIETPTWGDLKPMPVFRALTLDNSVMHVEAVGEVPENIPSVKRLALTEDGYLALLEGIHGSFAVEEEGRISELTGVSYGDADRFFEARGHFNAFLGCNTWTARMLRLAGIQTGVWNPLPMSLTVSLDLHN